MTSKILLTTDLHLSERNDEQYRFALFDWITNTYGKSLDAVCIAGDLTDRKNYHADWFVNKVVTSIRRLSLTCPVYILKGNHDYDANPNEPFFGFLSSSRVIYIRDPEVIPMPSVGITALMLPHTRSPVRDWGILDWKGLEPDFILMHQTFRGAKAESGITLDGMDPRWFRQFDCPKFSGDIHVPQRVGSIEYIGCPYHIHYGDSFEPRILLLDEKLRVSSARFPAPQKLVVDLTRASEFKNYFSHQTRAKPIIKTGDWVKVKLHLPRSEFGSWEDQRDKIRLVAKNKKIKLQGPILKELRRERSTRRKRLQPQKHRSPIETFNQYCERYNIDTELRESGRELIGN